MAPIATEGRRSTLLVLSQLPENPSVAPSAHARHVTTRHATILVTRTRRLPTFLGACERVVAPRRLPTALYPAWALAASIRRRRRVSRVWTSRGLPSVTVGYAMKRLFGIPWIADVWDDPRLFVEIARADPLPRRWWSVPAARLASAWILRAVRRADAHLFTLHPSAHARMGWEAKRAVFVTNGVDVARLRALAPGAAPRPASFTLVYVGHVKRIRGVGVAIGALARLRRSGEARLRLVGPATKDEAAWVRAEAARAGVADAVDLVGEVPHAEALGEMRSAHACLFPFPAAPELDPIYPIKVLEYMALGRPIVASRLRGVADLLRDGENALLVAPEDVDAWADACERLRADPALATALGARAAKDAEAFDWTRILDAADAELLARGLG